MNYTIDELEKYYDINHRNQIFYHRVTVNATSFYILYTYDRNNEPNNFVFNFTEYFPYYVRNADALECIDKSVNLSIKLCELSKKFWIGPTVPHRPVNVNGIFGEVFLDFYARIIKNYKLVTTYASRRGFKSGNESKGFDNVFFRINGGNIEYIFAEAKFVKDKGSAVKSLKEDIIGKSGSGGHLSVDFINQFVEFVVQKNSFFSQNDRSIVLPFIDKLNDISINGDGDYIKFFIKENIKISCVFFAIFQGSENNPNYIQSYKDIYNEAKQSLENMGIKNYGVEIVFIPTLSSSMDLKGAINSFYGNN